MPVRVRSPSGAQRIPVNRLIDRDLIFVEVYYLPKSLFLTLILHLNRQTCSKYFILNRSRRFARYSTLPLSDIIWTPAIDTAVQPFPMLPPYKGQGLPGTHLICTV